MVSKYQGIEKVWELSSGELSSPELSFEIYSCQILDFFDFCAQDKHTVLSSLTQTKPALEARR